MRNYFRSLAIALALCLGLELRAADDILARMDKAAPAFNGMTANLKKLTHTAVINDNSEEQGTFKLRRSTKRELQAIIDFSKPDPKTVAFAGKKAQIYYPKMKTVQEYNLGKQGGMVEQFLTLGFGTTGKELTASYDVRNKGDAIVAGEKTVHLELLPKDAKLKEKLQKLDLWMAVDGSHPVQQKFLQPAGDYHVFTYLDAKLNTGLTEDALKLVVPKGTKREVVQK